MTEAHEPLSGGERSLEEGSPPLVVGELDGARVDRGLQLAEREAEREASARSLYPARLFRSEELPLCGREPALKEAIFSLP